MPSRAHFAETAARLFAAAGALAQAGTLTRSTPGAYDPATGSPGAPIVATSACSVLCNRTTRPRFAVDGIEVAEDEEALWLHGATFPPMPGDMLAVAGGVRVVRGVRNLLEADALYLIVCK